ncbi:helix-turn-helix domain-containing protein [Streptosporangium sandarakinum]
MQDGRPEKPLMSDYLRSIEEMRRSLEKRDIGAVFELLNKRGGVSLRVLGSAVGMTASRVQEIIKGKRQVTSIEVFERIADALQIPGQQLGLADRPWEHERFASPMGTARRSDTPSVSISDPGLPWTWDPPSTVDAMYRLTRSDLMLDRRQAAKALAVTVGLPLIDPVQRWLGPLDLFLPPERKAGRIGEDDVDRLEGVTRAFRSWDDSFGGGLARKAVIGQLNEVAELLKDEHPPKIALRLHHVMAELAKIAATMSWDCGYQAAAQKYFVLGLQAVKPTRDRLLGASILASMARQLLYLGRADDALELVRLAQDGSRSSATPRIRAMLHTREAWAYAALGRREAFWRATAMAEDAFGEVDGGDQDPYWITYFDAAELAGVTGGRLLDLAYQDRSNAADGIGYVTRALQLRSPQSLRSHALDQVGLAQLHLLSGDLDEAARVGATAVETAQRCQSGRVRAQLQELYSQTSSRRDQRDIAELRARLQGVLTS